MTRILNRILIAALAASALPVWAAAAEMRFDGLAYDAKSGELVYRESHRVESSDQGLRLDTTYQSPDGTPIAKRQVRFGADPLAPEYELVDERLGRREGVEIAGEQIEVFVDNGAERDRALLSRESARQRPLVIDAGFDRLIAQRWDDLASGDTVPFEFLSTARLERLDFRVRKVGARVIDGEAVSDFELALSNFFLRMLVPPIRVSYYDRDRSLCEYRGISNIKDARGKNYDVVIRFPLSLRSSGPNLLALAPEPEPPEAPISTQ